MGFFFPVLYRFVTSSNRICLLDKRENKTQFIPQHECILDVPDATIVAAF